MSHECARAISDLSREARATDFRTAVKALRSQFRSAVYPTRCGLYRAIGSEARSLKERALTVSVHHLFGAACADNFVVRTGRESFRELF